MLRNKRSEKGKCVGEMSNWPGFRGWPNSEGLAIVWHQGDLPDQVRAQKGWQLTAWLPCSPPCEKNLQGSILQSTPEKTVLGPFCFGDIQISGRTRFRFVRAPRAISMTS
jgi:hypothetical protein